MIGGTIIGILTICFLIQYLRELWYYFRRRSEYVEVALKMRYGEFGGNELSARARLTFGYPFFIIVGGVTSVGVLWGSFGS